MRIGALVAAWMMLTAGHVAGQSREWRVDLGATALAEAWDYNESREVLAGVAVGVERRLWKPLGLRVEGLALHVAQQPRDAWLTGIAVGTRARWLDAVARPYIDLAVGLAGATRDVPQRGTAFNYLIVAGGGVAVPAGRLWVDVGARWLHISNNGRAGRARNPDVQSLGLSVAIGLFGGR